MNQWALRQCCRIGGISALTSRLHKSRALSSSLQKPGRELTKGDFEKQIGLERRFNFKFEMVWSRNVWQDWKGLLLTVLAPILLRPCLGLTYLHSSRSTLAGAVMKCSARAVQTSLEVDHPRQRTRKHDMYAYQTYRP